MKEQIVRNHLLVFDKRYCFQFLKSLSIEQQNLNLKNTNVNI
jgi:hypothetical protein